jgi:hypothetical protein
MKGNIAFLTLPCSRESMASCRQVTIPSVAIAFNSLGSGYQRKTSQSEEQTFNLHVN